MRNKTGVLNANNKYYTSILKKYLNSLMLHTANSEKSPKRDVYFKKKKRETKVEKKIYHYLDLGLGLL